MRHPVGLAWCNVRNFPGRLALFRRCPDDRVIPLSKYKDDAVSSIEIALMPPAPKLAAEKKDVVTPAPRQKKVKSYSRQILFPAKTLRNDADIDAYVEKVREQLRNLLENCDEIKLN